MLGLDDGNVVAGGRMEAVGLKRRRRGGGSEKLKASIIILMETPCDLDGMLSHESCCICFGVR